MATFDEALGWARQLLGSGDLPRAETVYRRLIEAEPSAADAWHELGIIHLQSDRPQAALECLRQAVALAPRSAAFHVNLGSAYRIAKQPAEAIASFERALKLSPATAEVLNNLALSQKDVGQFDAALQSLDEALRLRPDYANGLFNRANLLLETGQLEAAAAGYQRAIDLQPDDPFAHCKLGMVRCEQAREGEASSDAAAMTLPRLERLAQAAACFRRALELKPDYLEAQTNLAIVTAERQPASKTAREAPPPEKQVVAPSIATIADAATLAEQQGNLDEAANNWRQALELQPDFAEAHNHLATVLRMQGRLDEAAASCQRAVELNPLSADSHMNLAVISEGRGDAEAAIAHYRRAIALRPGFFEAHHNLGGALAKQGQFDGALIHFRQALEIRPDFATARSNALLALQYQSDVTLEQLAVAHHEYELRHAAPLRATWQPHDNQRAPDRKLRLGFVSADFCFHPVGVFLVRALENLDPTQAETFCYCDGPREDAMTNRLRAATNAWRDVRSHSDEQLAEQIRADGIDIAFDLAGHTGRNRLLMFARKPAPVQITWLGYVGTTGLAAIDYLLADRYEVPEGSELFFAERILRLPDDYVCYDPPLDAPPVNPLPALTRGFVTFGSFNNFTKITPAVVDVWAAILNRVGGSRLVLRYSGLDAPTVAKRISDLFAQAGVDSSRLDLHGGTNHADFLRGYHDLDIALDPFPYSGGITTCEAIWMGVPVVTCPGETFAGRHSLSHLSNAGLTETIAASHQDYIDIAARLAGDLSHLASLRSRLREQVADSPLCDGQRFAVNLQRVLRSTWREWCAGEAAK